MDSLRKAKNSKIYCSSRSPVSLAKWRVFLFWKRWNSRWTYLHLRTTGRKALLFTQSSSPLDRSGKVYWYESRKRCPMCNIWKSMSEARSSDGWRGVEKITSRRIRILFPATHRTLCTVHFSFPTIGSKSTFFRSHKMFIADFRNRFRSHPELPNKVLALHHIYAEIKQGLNALG